MPPDLLSALAAYIPHDRVATVLDPEATLARDGVALMADIAGFTALTEALAQNLRPDQGAEELTRILERTFTPLIDEVHAFGGSVIKFGGDALIVWFGRQRRGWRSAVIRRALTAAWKMQQVMKTQGSLSTTVGAVALEMTVGLAYGPVMRLNLGVREYGYEDVLVGATLDRMAAAEEQAQPGEIVVDAATLAHVPEAVTETRWRGDFAALTRLSRPSRPKPNPPLSWPADPDQALIDSLAAYVPPQIYDKLVLGQAQVAELRPVVSLFIQFYGLDYESDPAVADRLQTYFVTAQRIVARYDGRLNRLITGDKGSLLHVIFGAPRTVEEQEARAVRCALDLRAEGSRHPFITGQYMGVSAGRVFAGPVGSPIRHDYTVMGDAVNLSARLMQQAALDQILMETAVRIQLGSEFEIADLGQIRVEGKEEPVALFAALGARMPRRRQRARSVAPLFGRDEEVALLQQRLSVLSSGQGGVVSLVGEVGMGKTYMLDALRARSEEVWASQSSVNGRWASGISLAYGQSLSGYLFIDLLRDLLALPSGSGPERASQHLFQYCLDLFGRAQLDATFPYLARFMGLPLTGEFARRLEGLTGENLRWRLFQLIPEMFRLLSRRQPLVLALDDLQWADPTSLQLIESLLPVAANDPLLLILANRPERNTGVWRLRQEIMRAGSVKARDERTSTITLRELDEATAVELIAYHAPDLPSRLVDYLVEKGGGNPLFLVELVRTLQAQGLLSRSVDLDQLALDALDLPSTVQGLLLAQLDRLAVEARHTLQLASVIGRTFLDKVLAVLAGAEEELAQRLEELEDKAYVRSLNPAELGGRHAFRHILIQESAYSTLLYERRRAYHHQVATALERLFPARIAEQAALIAHHYERAGSVDEAVYYYLEVADRSRLLHANEEAESLYEKVLALLEEQPEPDIDRQARIYLKMAQVRANASNFASAQEYYERAFALFEKGEQGKDGPLSQTVGDEGRMFRWGILPQYTRAFDPGLVEELETWQIVTNVFQGLVELDNEWNVIPALAQRWQVTDAGRRYEFKLRPNLKWSDGSPLTAHDFVFAWRRNLRPETEARLAHQLFVVENAEAFHSGDERDPAALGIKAVDDLTLEINLKLPATYFPYLLAYPITFPQPAHAVRRLGAAWARPENVVCSNAFKVSEVQIEDAIHLVRNRYYRGYTTGNLDTVILRFVEPTLASFEDAKVDWCLVGDRRHLPQQYPQESHLVQALATYFLGFAAHRPPFHQRLVRQAFVKSIDRRALVRDIWSNVQKPASGGFVPPGMPGHSPEIGLGFDPEVATAMLRRAGYDTGEALSGLKLAALPGFGDTPRFLQEAWRQYLGVEIDVANDVLPEQALADLNSGNVQLVLLGYHVAYPDPDDILRDLFHRDSASNYFGWRNNGFDDLVDRAIGLADLQERLTLYHQADKVLVREETAVAPLYYLQAYGLLRSPFHFLDSGKIVRGSTVSFKRIWVDQSASR